MAAVSDNPGTVPLPARWAVLGKQPGRSMGYEVLDGSLPGDRAQRYLWSATTGTPDGRDPAGGLPWRVFLSTADGEDRPVCAVVDTTWDGSKDGTSRPSYTWRLLLAEWQPASLAGVTWTSLGRAAAQADPVPGADLTLRAERTPAAELAATVDRLGFDWAAGIAALLLDGRHLVITAPRGGTLPDLDERVRILDAVCALLPYGCRTWLSGATWAGKTEHGLRLVFASSARTGQLETPLRTGRPPAPSGDTARTYLAELTRVRAKYDSTTDVVAHLLAATAPVPLREGADAVRVLREMDLLDSVLDDVRQGRGRLDDVRRLLDLHAVETLDAQRQREVVRFLGRAALRPDGAAAAAVLAHHWTGDVPDLLAADVVAQPASLDTFGLARGYLSLMQQLEGPARARAFGRLFAALATTPGYDPVWVGQLAFMVEQKYGYSTESVDRVLARTPKAGLAWVRGLFADNTRELRPLERLLAFASTAEGGPVPGWLRFAGALTGHCAPAEVGPADAAEFTGSHEDGWRIALETARHHRRPEAIGPMWPVLRQTLHGSKRAELLPLLEALAPADSPGVPPATAADADLLWLLSRAAGPDYRPAPALPRLRHLAADATALDRYAAVLVTRTEGDPDLRDKAVAALLGERPDPVHGWPVLTRWMRQRPSIEITVGEELARRLMAADYAHWLGLDLPEELVERMERSGLGWLRPVRRLRLAINAAAPLDELARIIISGSPHRSVTGRLLDEVAALLRECGAEFAFRLTTELDGQQPGFGYGVYQALGRDSRFHELRARLIGFSTQEEMRHRRIIGALSAPAGYTTTPPPGQYGHRPHHPPTPPATPGAPPAPIPATPPPQSPDGRSGHPPQSPPPPDDQPSRRLRDKFISWGRP